MAESGLAKLMQGPAGWAAGAVAVVVVAAVGYALWPQPQVPVEASAPVATEGAEPVAAAGNETAAADTPDTGPVPETAVSAPAFDVVRVEPDGSAVIAGRAGPGREVEIRLDGRPLGRAMADDAGNFVALLSIPPAQIARVLTLAAPDDDGAMVVSEQSAIVAPGPVATGTDMALAETDTPVPGDGAASGAGAQNVAPADATGTADAGPAMVSDGDGTAPAASPGDGTVSEPAQATAEETADAATVGSDGTESQAGTAAAPRVLMADSEGITVVQPGGTEPEVMGEVTLDSITYDPAGEVALAGRGTGAAAVRVYLDNRPIRTVRIEEDGQWRAPLPEVDSGIYTLRVDQLAEDGSVTSRVETPFKREEPAQLAAVAAEVAGQGVQAAPDDDGTVATMSAPPVQAVTVQPGSTLWAIARTRYGHGILYVRVFEANRDQIRNPDLIYPGQVFTLPSE